MRNTNAQVLPKYSNKANLPQAKVAQYQGKKLGSAELAAFQRQENARAIMISDYQKYNQKMMNQMEAAA